MKGARWIIQARVAGTDEIHLFGPYFKWTETQARVRRLETEGAVYNGTRVWYDKIRAVCR